MRKQQVIGARLVATLGFFLCFLVYVGASAATGPPRC